MGTPVFFFFGCAEFSLLCGFSPLIVVVSRGATLCCNAQASHCGDFSCCRAQALGTWALLVAEYGL